MDQVRSGQVRSGLTRDELLSITESIRVVWPLMRSALPLTDRPPKGGTLDEARFLAWLAPWVDLSTPAAIVEAVRPEGSVAVVDAIYRWWEALLRRLNRNDFLCGRKGGHPPMSLRRFATGQAGHRGWFVEQLLAGAYDDNDQRFEAAAQGAGSAEGA